jgi:hypothetical protein
MSFWQGDYRATIQTNEGQLGDSVFRTMTGNLNMTPAANFTKLYYRYFLTNNTGGTLSIRLPLINTALFTLNRVEVGRAIIIKNEGANIINVITPTTSLIIVSILADEEVIITARQNNGTALTDWEFESRVSSTGGGGGGAPTTASYITFANDASLTSERVLTAGTGISLVDGGSTLTISSAGGGGPSFSAISYTATVSGTSAVNRDSNVSILSDGTFIEGHGVRGCWSVSNDAVFDNTAACGIKLDTATRRCATLFRNVGGTYSVQLFILGATQDSLPASTVGSPIPVNLTGIPNGSEAFPKANNATLVRLTGTSFVIMSRISSTSTLYIRVAALDPAVLDIGPEVSIFPVGASSSSVRGVSLASGAEFVAIYVITGVTYDLMLQHYTVSLTFPNPFLTATAAPTTIPYPAGTELDVLYATAINATQFVLYYEDRRSPSLGGVGKSLAVITWDPGLMTFSAGASVTAGFTIERDFGDNISSPPVVLSPTLVAVVSNDNKYSVFSISGTTLTPETLNASIGLSSSLIKFDSPNFVGMDNIDGTNVVATYNTENGLQIIHGTVAGASPFAITWGADEKYNFGNMLDNNLFLRFSGAGCVQYLTATRGFVCVGDVVCSFLIDSGTQTITIDAYRGEYPVGLAQATVAVSGSLTATLGGAHTIDPVGGLGFSLITGKFYFTDALGTSPAIKRTSSILTTVAGNPYYRAYPAGTAVSTTQLSLNLNYA